MSRRVVCDTNTVVSALLFQNGRLAWLRSAWRDGRVVPLVCRETVEELLRVLTYPKFSLTRSEIDELLGDFLPFAKLVQVIETGIKTDCRDPTDQIFLSLAQAANADAVISGDKDLLALAKDFSVPIMTPSDLKRDFSTD